jgi:hypothetical protein
MHALRAIRMGKIKRRTLRYILFVFLGLAASLPVFAQSLDTLAGEVTYKTSQSIYVRFVSTQDIVPGDTLFRSSDQGMIPALVVRHISSTSCVGTPIGENVFEVGDRILAKKVIEPEPEPVTTEDIMPTPIVVIPEDEKDQETEPVKEAAKPSPVVTDKLKGRISAASYIYFSDDNGGEQQRMRYTVSMNAKELAGTRLGLETYISFRHTINEWQEVKDDFHRAFKVYTLALQYDIDEKTKVWAGRKINFNMSNIGAIDGVQVERKWNKLTTGLFAGSKPDHTNYSFNSHLFQAGAYLGHTMEAGKGTIQNTLAFAEQRNHGNTDRRFAYLQHINSAIPRVNIFTSFEFDLFTLDNTTPKSTFDITSIYFSLRYKVSDKLSVFGSYDARKNIIYYETYKNFIDQLLEDETRQGLRFSFNFRPLKAMTLGASAGYRFQKDNPNPSRNLHSYFTVSKIPALKASGTLSFTVLQTGYLDGIIYGIRLSRDILKGKLFGEIEFKRVRYQYTSVEFPLNQSIAGFNLSWRMTKKLSLSANYEGEIQNNEIRHRIYTNLIQRF